MRKELTSFDASAAAGSESSSRLRLWPRFGARGSEVPPRSAYGTLDEVGPVSVFTGVVVLSDAKSFAAHSEELSPGSTTLSGGGDASVRVDATSNTSRVLVELSSSSL